MMVCFVCSGDGTQHPTHVKFMPHHLATALRMWALQTWPTPGNTKGHSFQMELDVCSPYPTWPLEGLTMSITSSPMKLWLWLSQHLPPPFFPCAQLCSSLQVHAWASFSPVEGCVLYFHFLSIYVHSSLSSFSPISLQHGQQLPGCFHVLTLSPV